MKAAISKDDELNPILKNQVQCLRGAINTGVTSERFSKIPHPDEPAMIIKDNVSGKTVKISLYAVSAVMETLSTLFE